MPTQFEHSFCQSRTLLSLAILQPLSLFLSVSTSRPPLSRARVDAFLSAWKRLSRPHFLSSPSFTLAVFPLFRARMPLLLYFAHACPHSSVSSCFCSNPPMPKYLIYHLKCLIHHFMQNKRNPLDRTSDVEYQIDALKARPTLLPL